LILLFGQDEPVAEWVGRNLGKPFHAPYTAIGVINEAGRLTGGFVFTGYNQDSIELSLCGRGIAARGAWSGVLNYVFDQLKCSRLQMHTRTSNKTVCRQLGKFLPRRSYEGICRRFYGAEDAVLYALTVDDLPKFREKWKI